jgi:hypothetical protein
MLAKREDFKEWSLLKSLHNYTGDLKKSSPSWAKEKTGKMKSVVKSREELYY